MRADNTRHIITAARQRTKQTRQRAVTTLRRIDAAGQPITLASLASQAASPDPGSTGRTISSARSSVSATAARPPGAQRFRRQRASSTSLLQRLEAATDRIRRLESENQQLRDALARALGERRAAEILGQTHSRDTPNRKTPEII